MKNPRFGWAATDRSLTLLRAFLLASAAILVVGAVILGSTVSSALRDQALSDASKSNGHYVRGVLNNVFALRPGRLNRLEVDPHLVGGAGSIDGYNVTLSPIALLFIEQQLGLEFVQVRVWDTSGTLRWASHPDAEASNEPNPYLRKALATHRSVAEMWSVGHSESTLEHELGLHKVLATFTPIRDSRGAFLGVYEVHADPRPLEHSIATRKHEMWLIVGLVFAALYVALILLVRAGSRSLAQRTRALRQQSKELADAYAQLEQSSMEAIESLNATVDARDPYTAGHSQRVQRIALAIGEEMGLAPERMRTLAFGALFHDIGKLGVPDAILLKPGRLTGEEYSIIKRHAEEGARIVERFSPLRPAVPVVLHHHEHFTGGGYPLGLEGREIPLEAAVVGLADAWDAMTTDRPYRSALSDAEALEEIRTCSGSQFDPEIVEAFLTAYAKDPGRFGPGGYPLEVPELKLVAG